MKKVIFIVFSISLFVLSIGGCISTEQHNALIIEKNALLVERSALLAEKDAILAQKETLDAERDALLADKEILVAEKNTLAIENAILVLERDALVVARDALAAEKGILETEIQNIQKATPLKGFSTLSEFKGWIMAHIQPETTYLDDAFLAACKVQEEAMADGYLMGLDIDDYGDDEGSVVLTTFVGNQLYWWFVEDEELYASMGEWYRR